LTQSGGVHSEAVCALGEAFPFDSDIVEAFAVKGAKAGGVCFEVCFDLGEAVD
jgi:hypothetical protein